MDKKTASAIMLTLLLTSMLTLAFNIQPVKAEPRTWIVDDNGAGDFNTIQQAINAASDGDIIFVCNGTYYEHLTIDKSLSLIGESKWYTTIDGNSTGDVVSITSNDTKIVNFTIQYGYSGISLLHCRDNNISSNILLNNYRGIAVNCSSNNLIFHNDFMNNTQQVYDYSWDNPDYSPSTNMWDDGYPSGGNYWSQYTGNDTYSGPFQNITCSDGIGDTPYAIDQNNKDRYPLMLPWDDPYNHQAAYDYAYKYYNRVCSDEYYWYYDTYPPWWWPPSQPLPSEPHFDCAHFVSCCIGSEPHEMGGGLPVPDIFPGHPVYGDPSVGRLKDWLLTSGYGKRKYSVNDLIRGDVIFYRWAGQSWGGGGKFLVRHSALYLGDGLISSHDYSRWNRPWYLDETPGYWDPWGLDPSRGEVVFVHIADGSPQVSTKPATGVGETYATLNGYLDSTGGETCEVWFVWDTTSHSSYVDYSHSTSHQTGKTSAGSFSQYISGLAPGVTYHFRAVAKNYEGTVQGNDLFFKTPYTLIIQVDGSGTTNPVPGTYEYNPGTNVQVTAYPSSGWILHHWELDSVNVGNANPYTVIMNSNHILKAVFTYSPPPPPPDVFFYQVGVGTDFTGTVLTVDGVNYGAAAAAAGITITKNVGDSISFTYHSPLDISTLKRYVWTHTLGLSTAQSGTIQVPSGGGSVTGYYKTQYKVTFAQTELDNTAIGTVVTVAGVPKTYTDLPFTTDWVDHGFSLTFGYSDIVASSVSGKRFKLVSVSHTSPLTVTAPTTVTGNYKTQCQITVTASPTEALGGTFKVTYTQCGTTYTDVQKTTSWTDWADAGTTVTVSEPQDIINGSPGTRYKFDSYSPSASVTMNQAKTITLVYKTQYLLTIKTSGLPSAYPTKVYLGGSQVGTASDASPYTEWFDSGTSSGTIGADSTVSGATGTRYVFVKWVEDSSTNNPRAPETMNSPRAFTAEYKTQYLLTVLTDPAGLTPQPTRNPVGESGPANSWWYDVATSVTLTAQPVTGYTFNYWDVNGASQGSGVNPISVSVNAPKTATAYYTSVGPLLVSISPASAKIKVGESVSFTSSVSGGKTPYSYQWYLNGTAVSGATSPTWTFTPVTTGYYIVYLNVTDSAPNTAKSNEASVTVAPPLTVSISPMSASILVGQSVTFTSTVSGGYAPYSYQWYLDGAPVSGATTSAWVFTPATSGIYYVYLKVIDDNNNVAQSETARITVSTVPVGGYSIPIQVQTKTEPIIPYIALIAILTAIFTKLRPKTKRKH